MRLSKWLKRRKKKNPFEASMAIDNPDLKIVEARYREQPFFLGIGASKQRERKGAGGIGSQGVKGEYQSQKDLNWQFFYNLKALPDGFMPEEKLKDFMASTVSVVSGGATVVAEAEIKETELERLEKFAKEVEELEEEEARFRVFKDKDRDSIIIFDEKGEIRFRKEPAFDPKYDHIGAWLFYGPEISYEKGERHPRKNNPRHKLVYNTITKKAFYVDRAVWEMIYDEKIRWHSEDDQDLEKWCTKMGYELIKDDARERDLLALEK